MNRNRLFLVTIFLFFLLLVFFTYSNLFNSYFEADDWYHFTHYLPLTVKSGGWLIPIIKSYTDTQSLSGGQHIVPIGVEIFYLNTKFFGINFSPYAAISLFLHAFNSFLVFLFLKELLTEKKTLLSKRKRGRDDAPTITSLIAGTFFALNVSGMHAITWAAFYGQNVLSVTFFLLCLYFLLKGLQHARVSFIVVSALFFVLDLLTKETAVVLFFIIPIIIFYKRKVFSRRILFNIFLPPVFVYSIYRFLLPFLHAWADSQVSEQSSMLVPDISVVINRFFLFPLKMISEMFFSSDGVISLLQFITPFVYPQPLSVSIQSRSQNSIQFIYGPGNDLLVVLLAICILIIWFFMFRLFWKQKKDEMLSAMILSLAIMVFSALVLIPIGFAFPTWGYETYFDSRHFYLPTVGGAILFAVILYQTAQYCSTFINRNIRATVSVFSICIILWALWAIQDISILRNRLSVQVNVGKTGRLMVEDMKKDIPTLPKNAVFYIDANPVVNSYGSLQSIPPFQTHFGQILTVVYYDKNHLPDEFFVRPFLHADKSISSEGYFSAAGRGLGYFLSKRNLAENLLSGKVAITDVYAFSNDALKQKTKNITASVRQELQIYLKERSQSNGWARDESSLPGFSLFLPTDTSIKEEQRVVTDTALVKNLSLEHQEFKANLILKTLPITAPIIDESLELPQTSKKRLFFDRYHSNEMYNTQIDDTFIYKMKIGDSLILLTTQNDTVESRDLVEKMLGSITLQ